MPRSTCGHGGPGRTIAQTMICDRCKSTEFSMSATSGGVTWFRCCKCQYMQGQPSAGGPPTVPAVATHASAAKFAMDQQPTYSGTQVRNEIPATPGQPPPPLRTTASVAKKPEGCGMCGSGDIRFVLEADVGIDASDPAAGPSATVVRSPFCSLRCLAARFELVPPEAPLVDGAGVVHPS